MSNSAADQAAGALRDLILRGRYQPEDRLPPERELAEGLGVSRPTMREAIRRLMEAGLLQPRRGSGTYVANVDLEAVFGVRLQLEPYAARLAAGQRTSEQARRLSELLKRLAAELDEPDVYAATDFEIHGLISEAAGNSVLVDVLSRLAELSRLSRAITVPERQARVAGLHDLRALARAVRARDADAAAQAMQDHLESVRETARTAVLQRARDRRVISLSARAEGG
jgi:GntR family transcriptional regulator, transcriptional repressor for pyruvate dehydrogenase complex